MTISPHGARQVIVCPNSQRKMSPVGDPDAYRSFFAALEKAMFLTARQVD